MGNGGHSVVTSRCYALKLLERQLKLDMDVWLHRGNDNRRWTMKLNSDKWWYRRVLAGQETAGEADDYRSAKAERLELEAEIGHARVEGWR